MNFVSLFSGMGGFDLGLERAGLRCSLQVEIDPVCQQILARHWPGVERMPDVRTCTLPPADLVCGGFPCQDLSVAGRRQGLAGDRSGLWFEFHRILEVYRPRWCLIENVPGLLSSNEGADFAVLLRGLEELGYHAAWRILDAQYAGVAQRRQRVFIVGSLGDYACVEVLFESESLRWYPAPGRPPRQDLARPLGGSTQDGGFRTTDLDHGALVDTLRSGPDNPASHGKASGTDRGPFVVDARGNGDGHQTNTLTGDHMDRVTDYTPVVFEARFARNGRGAPEPIAPPLKAESGRTGKGDSAPLLAVVGPIAPNAGPGSHDAGNFHTNQGVDAGHIIPEFLSDPAAPIRGRGHTEGTNMPGRGGEDDENLVYYDGGDLADTLDSSQIAKQQMMPDKRRMPAVIQRAAVRRLTPLECERLQGFPDDWTKFADDGKHLSDSRRYRMIGNAVVPTIAEWIGRRILAVDDARRRQEAPQVRPASAPTLLPPSGPA